MTDSTFFFENKAIYKAWRDEKLSTYPLSTDNLMTNLADGQRPTAQEAQKILNIAQQHNLAFYRMSSPPPSGKTAVHSLAHACGLRNIKHNLCADPDSLTSIRMTQHAGQHSYIPYTNRRLSWHTDGYYNPPQQQIQGFLLHCVRPAHSGGANWLMDHEIAYILLREADPGYIEALSHPEAFTIPANILKGEMVRPEQSGPVFSVGTDGHLHMRYSARQRNVIWRDDPVTRKAEQFLLDLWEQDLPYKLHYTLQAGEGLLCNNVLHCRTEFTDSADETKQRLLYRGRYIDRLGSARVRTPIKE